MRVALPGATRNLLLMNVKLLPSVIIFVLLISLLAAAPAYAHGDEPRLEISADSLNPGDLLEIRGVDFEFEEEISLSLIGAETDIPLGVVTGDTEGVFLLSMQLPADLAEGTYTVQATTDDHVVASPPINVWGSAELGGGEEGAWEEGDSLLAPMPTAIPVTAMPVAQSESSESVPARNSAFPMVWVFVTFGVILIAAIFRVVRK